MKNLLQFIWNNQFTLLFLLLEFIGFALLTTNNSFHQSRLHSTSVAISGSIGSMQNSYQQYIGLKEENQRLVDENARLNAWKTQQGHGVDFISHPEYLLRPALTISSSYNQGNNYLIIDKGIDAGITSQNGVIGPKGVVGIVTQSSNHYSRVMPIIHSQCLISAKLAKNNYFGILKWDGNDPRFATLEDIPNHIGVFKGDSIVTRGSAGVFPPGQFIGLAASSEKDESSGFQSVRVELATDFRNVNNVYIIENQAIQELRTLNTNEE